MTKREIKKLISEIPDEEQLEFICYKKNNKKIDDSWMLGYIMGQLKVLKNFILKNKLGE